VCENENRSGDPYVHPLRVPCDCGSSASDVRGKKIRYIDPAGAFVTGHATVQAMRRRRSCVSFQPSVSEAAPGKLEWLFLLHETCQGKTTAIHTALSHANAELSVIHDADLQYHPSDLLRMVQVFLEEQADARVWFPLSRQRVPTCSLPSPRARESLSNSRRGRPA